MSQLAPNITTPNLDTKKPVGGHGIEAPVYGQRADIAKVMTASTNQGTDINMTYDHTNLSAKFKNPRVKQDVPEVASNQYETHN